eukprot:963551-Pyramimonas_sp.AAC.1
MRTRVPTRLKVIDRTTAETLTRCLEETRLSVDPLIDDTFPRIAQVSMRDEHAANRRAEGAERSTNQKT